MSEDKAVIALRTGLEVALELLAMKGEALGHDSERIQTYKDAVAELREALAAHEADKPEPLTPREHELLDGMIERELHHAALCDVIQNQRMSTKQKGWDMERVALLRKLKGTT